MEWTPVRGLGRVYSFVTIHQSTIPGFQDRVPFVVAWIELDEQENLRVLSGIVDCAPDQVHIGMRVQATFEVRDRATLPNFQPFDNGGERHQVPIPEGTVGLLG
jgi:uncharacterized OB-fold protein